MVVGERVKFTGHGYRRAKIYQYEKLFGDKTYRITEVRRSCCNTFIALEGIDGIYCEKFFSKAE